MVTIGFFEAAQDSPELLDLASRGAELFAPQAKILAAGIGAHLNYQAGFSLDAFDRVPAFGMPHSAPWYPEWFSDWKAHTMRSWEFETAPFFSRLAGLSRINDSGIRVRPLSFARLSRDIALYTELNNRCFADHPFWINRAPAEDLDLFLPFRPFLNPENLLFAEKDGKAIGFLLWYPDFNQLNPSGGLGLPELVNYRLAGRLPGLRGTITRFRLTQIAVLPEYRSSDASLKMISAIAPFIQRAGYTAGEAGFIFDDNAGSLALTSRFFSRVLGMTAERMKPKRFAVYTRGME